MNFYSQMQGSSACRGRGRGRGKTPWLVLSKPNTGRPLISPNSPNSPSSSSGNIPDREESSHQFQTNKTSTYKEILEVEAIFHQKNISELIITLERNDIPKINKT